MTWLEADGWDRTPMGERFQALLDRPGIVKAPGAHNAIAGVLAKAASGALEWVPLVRVGNLARSLDQLKSSGFWLVGLDGDAQQAMGATTLPSPLALVLGAEGSGLGSIAMPRTLFTLLAPFKSITTALLVTLLAASKHTRWISPVARAA